MDEAARLDPGADGKGKLAVAPVDASAEVQGRSKRFVSYRLLDEEESKPLHYALWTERTEIARGTGGAPDVLKPHLVAVLRSVGPGTTLQGNTDTLIPAFVRGAMPRWFGVVFMLTLLSAAMSTMSSQFHTMGTALGRDVFEQFAHYPHVVQSIHVTRFAILVGIVVALVLGKCVRGNIIALATAIFMGLCASSFLPMFVFGLFWRRMNRAAAVASLGVGFLTSAFWLVFVHGKTAAGLGLCRAWLGRDNLIVDARGMPLADWSLTWTVVDPIVVALPMSILTAVVVALATKPMAKAHLDYVYGGPKPVA